MLYNCTHMAAVGVKGLKSTYMSKIGICETTDAISEVCNDLNSLNIVDIFSVNAVTVYIYCVTVSL